MNIFRLLFRQKWLANVVKKYVCPKQMLVLVDIIPHFKGEKYLFENIFYYLCHIDNGVPLNPMLEHKLNILIHRLWRITLN
jgi:hypothetical protein